jgi:hypothetical protein
MMMMNQLQIVVLGSGLKFDFISLCCSWATDCFPISFVSLVIHHPPNNHPIIHIHAGIGSLRLRVDQSGVGMPGECR